MQLAIETVLEQRSRDLLARLPRLASLLISVALHVVLLAGVLIGPLVAVQQVEPIEFTPITIVPLQALGVETPAPAPPRVAPPPAPEPAEPQPAAEPQPEPDRAPMPAPDAERPRETPKPRAAKERPREPAATTEPTAAAGALGQRRGSPSGSTLGTAAFGAAVGGLDNPDFVYGYYVDQMLSMIDSNWLRPALGGEVTAMVHFRIHRDGSISDVRIAKSSGYNSFDLAGLRAVQLAAPFPKLPQSYRHESLGVNLILH